MFRLIRKFRRADTGATAIEYSLIAALVSLASIAALISLGGSVDSLFGGFSGVIDQAVNTGAGTASP